MAGYIGINHLALITNDMERTIHFWRDLLGLRIVAGFGAKGYRQYFFEVSAYDLVAFFEWPNVEPIPEKDAGRPVAGPAVFDHVSLGVKDDEMLWELKDRLNAAELFVSEVIDHGFIHSIYTFDPNAIAVEISYYVADMDIHANPIMADPHPVAAISEGLEPNPIRWPAVRQPTSRKDRKVYPGEWSILKRSRGKP